MDRPPGRHAPDVVIIGAGVIGAACAYHCALGTLSGGEQQMLAIGRALVAQPRLLMLDEPSMGLAPLLVAAVMDVIADVNAAGTAVLLVEQNAKAALRIANRAYVVESGTVTAEGPAAELAADSRVVEAYLGA